MTHIKTFLYPNDDLINKYIKDNNLELLNMFINSFVDYYDDGRVCNQGSYATVLFKENKGE